MTLLRLPKNSLTIFAAFSFLRSCYAVHDLSEFACVEPNKAVAVVYYEIGSITSLPSNSMKQKMHLAYDGDCISQINFPRSTSNFAGSGKMNNFVAYFEGQLQFPTEGVWTMYTASQDGSKLYIDDELVVNNNGMHKNMVEKDGTVTVSKDSQIKKFRLEYFKGEAGANGLILKWEGPGKNKQAVKPADFYSPESVTLIGLAAHAFMTPNVNATYYPVSSRNSLPNNFDSLAPTKKESGYVNSWPNEYCNLTDNYAVVLEGFLLFPSAGEYTITEESDDDARMYLDGELVMTVNGQVGVRDKGEATISITQGGTIKLLRMEFLQLCLGSYLELTWKGPKIPHGTPVEFEQMQYS